MSEGTSAQVENHDATIGIGLVVVDLARTLTRLERELESRLGLDPRSLLLEFSLSNLLDDPGR